MIRDVYRFLWPAISVPHILFVAVYVVLVIRVERGAGKIFIMAKSATLIHELVGRSSGQPMYVRSRPSLLLTDTPIGDAAPLTGSEKLAYMDTSLASW